MRCGSMWKAGRSVEFWNFARRRLKAGMSLWGFEDWNSGILRVVEAPLRSDNGSPVL